MDISFFPEFSPAEIAVLNFSNDPPLGVLEELKLAYINIAKIGIHGWSARFSSRLKDLFNRSPGATLVTDKHSVIWAVTVALLARNNLVKDEKMIVYAVYDAWRSDKIVQYLIGPTLHQSLSIEEAQKFERETFYSFYGSFLSVFTRTPPEEFLREVYAETGKATADLVERNLIVDPLSFALGGILVVIAGFMPFHFNSRRKGGVVVQRKIDAAYWYYHYKVERGIVTTDLNFRVVKFLQAFKKALREVSE